MQHPCQGPLPALATSEWAQPRWEIWPLPAPWAHTQSAGLPPYALPLLNTVPLSPCAIGISIEAASITEWPITEERSPRTQPSPIRIGSNWKRMFSALRRGAEIRRANEHLNGSSRKRGRERARTCE